MKFDTIIVDGRNLLWRAADVHHDLSVELSKSGTVRVGGIFGFLASLSSIRKHYKGSFVVVWEGTGNFRYDLYPQYKGNRRGVETEVSIAFRESLRDQERRLSTILRALGIPQYRGVGCEADDAIGTLATMAVRHGQTVAIYTNDSDLRQLASGKITIISPALGPRAVRDVVYGPRDVEAKYGIQNPRQLIDLKALAGDTSDNIPGASGLGAVTASKLLLAFAGLEDVIKAASDGGSEWPVAERFRTKISESASDLRLFKELVTVRRDVKLLPVNPRPDKERLTRLLRQYKFQSFFQRASYKLLLSVGCFSS